MLNPRRRGSSAPFHECAGYSLIELMISIAIGMILVASVLTVVVSILGSNADTIRVTRLTQELRTLVDVIGRDAERARLMADPLDNIGNPPNPLNADGASNPNTRVDTSTAGCLRFSYNEPDATAGDTDHTAVTFTLRNGAIFVGRTEDAVLETWADVNAVDRQRTTLVTCANATTRLSSPELTITNFDVRLLDANDADADGWVDCNEPESILTLSITGQLTGDADFVRTVTDRIRIGSSDLKVTCFP